MAKEGYVPIEEMEFFKQFVAVADRIWNIVSRWSPLAMDTVGKQLIRAIDRVGATIVEGDGRHSDAEAAHFFTIARGSARETRYWIHRAVVRHLIEPQEGDDLLDVLTNATRQLQNIIRYRRSCIRRASTVREGPAPYVLNGADPFTTD
jgi:four helix bundle protein